MPQTRKPARKAAPKISTRPKPETTLDDPEAVPKGLPNDDRFKMETAFVHPSKEKPERT